MNAPLWIHSFFLTSPLPIPSSNNYVQGQIQQRDKRLALFSLLSIFCTVKFIHFTCLYLNCTLSGLFLTQRSFHWSNSTFSTITLPRLPIHDHWHDLAICCYSAYDWYNARIHKNIFKIVFPWVYVWLKNNCFNWNAYFISYCSICPHSLNFVF